MKFRLSAAVAVLALASTLSACGSDPLSSSSSSGIVVGSANFGESKILAEIYAGALNARGIEATTRLDIGARKAYITALDEGTISLVPEYSGNLLTYYRPTSRAAKPDVVMTELKAALPKSLQVLEPSAAEDKDSLNVTPATALRYHLTAIGDLADVPNLRLAANPEFKTNSYGIPGLAKVYGLTKIAFTPISDGGGAATLKALLDGDVDVADIYSTTSSISANKLVTLDDPMHLIAAQNVVPLIRSDKNSTAVTNVLNEVSAKLTTAGLLALNSEFDGPSKPSAQVVAARWLKANGFS